MNPNKISYSKTLYLFVRKKNKRASTLFHYVFAVQFPSKFCFHSYIIRCSCNILAKQKFVNKSGKQWVKMSIGGFKQAFIE